MSPTITWLNGKPRSERYETDDFAQARARQIMASLPEEWRASVRVIPDDAPAPRCPNTLDLFSTTTGEDSAA